MSSFHGTPADECEVLCVCLRALRIGTPQVVHDRTSLGLPDIERFEDVWPRSEAFLRQRLRGLRGDTLADFRAKNAMPHPASPDLTLDGQLLCLDDATRRALFHDHGWDGFRQRFPQSNGIVDFSRVGLDAGLSQALIYAGMQAEWTSGYGGYYLYARSPAAGWAQSTTAMSWIS